MDARDHTVTLVTLCDYTREGDTQALEPRPLTSTSANLSRALAGQLLYTFEETLGAPLLHVLVKFIIISISCII